MFERKTDAEPNPGAERLVSLPSGYKEKVMTAEAIQKAALKSLKRKQLADEKREKDKVRASGFSIFCFRRRTTLFFNNSKLIYSILRYLYS